MTGNMTTYFWYKFMNRTRIQPEMERSFRLGSTHAGISGNSAADFAARNTLWWQRLRRTRPFFWFVTSSVYCWTLEKWAG